MNRRIIIKHGSVEHIVDVPNDRFDKHKEVIKQCIKNEGNCWIVPSEDGTERFFPAELLRNSVIIFEPSEIDLEIFSQRI
ncbi:hypothetical protein [Chryseobacterium jejuense]|uniref:hypothetical protein n=1 Tax=Chryseobacterium jejuense TaxID=445960 RepID=UPI001AEB0426|nr:hypothetical protein [Chryseobacterium jejuense]MBP2619203.1 hypothetical protein [Chryseobacterium jejuense]